MTLRNEDQHWRTVIPLFAGPILSRLSSTQTVRPWLLSIGGTYRRQTPYGYFINEVVRVLGTEDRYHVNSRSSLRYVNIANVYLESDSVEDELTVLGPDKLPYPAYIGQHLDPDSGKYISNVYLDDRLTKDKYYTVLVNGEPMIDVLREEPVIVWAESKVEVDLEDSPMPMYVGDPLASSVVDHTLWDPGNYVGKPAVMLMAACNRLFPSDSYGALAKLRLAVRGTQGVVKVSLGEDNLLPPPTYVEHPVIFRQWAQHARDWTWTNIRAGTYSGTPYVICSVQDSSGRVGVYDTNVRPVWVQPVSPRIVWTTRPSSAHPLMEATLADGPSDFASVLGMSTTETRIIDFSFEVEDVVPHETYLKNSEYVYGTATQAPRGRISGKVEATGGNWMRDLGVTLVRKGDVRLDVESVGWSPASVPTLICGLKSVDGPGYVSPYEFIMTGYTNSWLSTAVGDIYSQPSYFNEGCYIESEDVAAYYPIGEFEQFHRKQVCDIPPGIGDFGSGKWIPTTVPAPHTALNWTPFAYAYPVAVRPGPTPTVHFPWEEPTDPTIPTDPTVPTDPTDPTDPPDPTGPTDPTDPTDPPDPTDPTDPTSPTDPDGIQSYTMPVLYSGSVIGTGTVYDETGTLGAVAYAETGDLTLTWSEGPSHVGLQIFLGDPDSDEATNAAAVWTTEGTEDFSHVQVLGWSTVEGFHGMIPSMAASIPRGSQAVALIWQADNKPNSFVIKSSLGTINVNVV